MASPYTLMCSSFFDALAWFAIKNIQNIRHSFRVSTILAAWAASCRPCPYATPSLPSPYILNSTPLGWGLIRNYSMTHAACRSCWWYSSTARSVSCQHSGTDLDRQPTLRTWLRERAESLVHKWNHLLLVIWSELLRVD